MKKNQIKHYAKVFILSIFSLLMIASFANCIPFGKYLFNYSDAYVMYPSLLNFSVKSLFSGEFFYNLHSALGSDFYNVRTLYMNSPLNLLYLLFKKENIFFFYTFLIFLRTGLSSVTMCIYLNSTTKNKYTWRQILFSLIYSLSSYSIAYSVHIMWMDSFILLPLIILGLDKLIKENKASKYIIFLTLAILINFYIGYMLCIFSVLYYFYKSYVTNQFSLKKLKTFVISSLLCGLLSSIVIIPQFFSLIAGRGNTFEPNKLLGINIFSLFSMPANLISGTFSYYDIKQSGSPMIYCTVFVIVMNILYYFNTKFNAREKRGTLILTIFLLLSLFIHFIDYAWNMFQEPLFFNSRYSFVIIFFLISIAYQNFENQTYIKIKKGKVNALLIVFSLLVLASFTFKAKVIPVPNSYIISLFISIIVFIIYLAFLSKPNYRFIVILCIFSELAYNGYTIFHEETSINQDTSKEYISMQKTFDELKDYDNSFYRTLFPNSFANDSMYFDFYSGELFSSSQDYQTKNFFIHKIDYSRESYNTIQAKFNNPALMSLFSFKYIVGQSSYYKEISKNIYENSNALNMGIVIPNKIINPDLIAGEYQENIEKIYSSLLNEETKLFQSIEFIDSSIEEKTDKENNKLYYISYSFISPNSGVIIPKKSKIYELMNIKVNDELLTTKNNVEYQIDDHNDFIYYVNQYDKVEISFRLTEKQLESYEINRNNFEELKVVILDEKLFYEAITKLKNYSSLNNISTSGHVLSGTIESEGGTMFLSIPYLNTFTIKIDGKEVDYHCLFDSFIGFDVTSGEHEITIDYLPSHFKMGTYLSIIGLFLTILFFRVKKI